MHIGDMTHVYTYIPMHMHFRQLAFPQLQAGGKRGGGIGGGGGVKETLSLILPTDRQGRVQLLSGGNSGKVCRIVISYRKDTQARRLRILHNKKQQSFRRESISLQKTPSLCFYTEKIETMLEH
jgi:hypothetical protein